MTRLHIALIAVFIVCLAISTHLVGASRHGDRRNAVRLENVKTLTLHKNAMSTAFRGSPVQQLRCVGNYCPSYQLPNVVQCYNQGFDDKHNIQWKCDAEIDASISFDQITVSCEGYDHRDDPYILAGSCGLSYSLTHKPVTTTTTNTHTTYPTAHHHTTTTQAVRTDSSDAFMAIVLLIAIAAVFTACIILAPGPSAPAQVVYVEQRRPWYRRWLFDDTHHVHYHHGYGTGYSSSSSFWPAPTTSSTAFFGSSTTSSSNSSGGTKKSSGFGGTVNR